MNVARAFARRAALRERLDRIERTGSLGWQYSVERSSRDCPESVSGHDSRADGRCHWCGKKVDPAVPGDRRYVPTIDLQDVLDPLTLEPVDALDRDGYKIPGNSWDTAHYPRPSSNYP